MIPPKKNDGSKNNKSDSKLFFPMKIPFYVKKQYLPTKTNDKAVIMARKELEDLKKEHQKVSEELAVRRVQYEEDKALSQMRHQEEKQINRKFKEKILRLEVQRDQLKAKEDTSVAHYKAEVLKKYLRCLQYSLGNQYEYIRGLGSITSYDRRRNVALFVWMKRETVKQLLTVVFAKKIIFNEQYLMFVVKNITSKPLESEKRQTDFTNFDLFLKKPTVVLFQLSVYAITGPFFHFTRRCSSSELKQHASAIRAGNFSFDFQKLGDKQLFDRTMLDSKAQSANSPEASDPDYAAPLTHSLPYLEPSEKLLPDESNIINEPMTPSPANMVKKHRTSLRNSRFQDAESMAHIQLWRNFEELSKFTSQGSQESLSQFAQSPQVPDTNRQIGQKISVMLCDSQFLDGQQKILFPRHNPLQNILLIPSQNKFCFLQDYLRENNQAKGKLITFCICKFRFKVRVQRERQNLIYYKVTNFNRFFETQNRVIPPYELKVLIMLKASRNDVILTIESIDSKAKYHLTISTKLFDERFAPTGLQSHRKRSNQWHHTAGFYGDNGEAAQRRTSNASNLSQDSKEIVKKEAIARFYGFLQGNLISLFRNQFLRIIPFENNLKMIIRIQSFQKMTFYRHLYKKIVKPEFSHFFSRVHNILVSLFQSNGTVSIFVENVIVHQGQRRLDYSAKYFKVAASACQQSVKLGTVIEARDYIEVTAAKQIAIYEAELQRLEKLKPLFFYNRLKKFIMLLSLRVKSRRSIFFIKKIKVDGETCALLVRRSPLIKDLYEVNLYPLDSGLADAKDDDNQEEEKPQYQTIYLFRNFLQKVRKDKVQELFLITKQHILLRPQPPSANTHYVERLLRIDLNCEQVQREKVALDQQERNTISHQRHPILPLNIRTSKQSEAPSAFQVAQSRRLLHKSSLEIIQSQPYNYLFQLHRPNDNYVYYSMYKEWETFWAELFIISTKVNAQSKEYQCFIRVYREAMDVKIIKQANDTLPYLIAAKLKRSLRNSEETIKNSPSEKEFPPQVYHESSG